jgi:hypothetical protein
MKKIISVLLLVTAIVSMATVNAYAYNTFNDHKMINGVGQSANFTRHYWINSSASGYSGIISNAIYTWDHTASTPGVSTSIWFTSTSAQSYSVMDIYASTGSSNGVLGETKFFSQNGNHNSIINPNNGDWRWTEIHLYNSVLNTVNSFNKQGSVCHEMGHVFGLAHNYNTGSVMCQLSNGRSVNRPSADDCNGINHLY